MSGHISATQRQYTGADGLFFPWVDVREAKSLNTNSHLDILIEFDLLDTETAETGRALKMQLMARGHKVITTFSGRCDELVNRSLMLATLKMVPDARGSYESVRYDDKDGFCKVTWTETIQIIYLAELHAKVFKLLKLKAPFDGFPLSTKSVHMARKTIPGFGQTHDRQAQKWICPGFEILTRDEIDQPGLPGQGSSQPCVAVTEAVNSRGPTSVNPPAAKRYIYLPASADSYDTPPTYVVSGSTIRVAVETLPLAESPGKRDRDLDTASVEVASRKRARVERPASLDKIDESSSVSRTNPSEPNLPVPHMRAPETATEIFNFSLESKRFSDLYLQGCSFELIYVDDINKVVIQTHSAPHTSIIQVPILHFPSIATSASHPDMLITLIVKRHIPITLLSIATGVATCLGQKISARWNQASHLRDRVERVKELKEELIDFESEIRGLNHEIETHEVQAAELISALSTERAARDIQLAEWQSERETWAREREILCQRVRDIREELVVREDWRLGVGKERDDACARASEAEGKLENALETIRGLEASGLINLGVHTDTLQTLAETTSQRDRLLEEIARMRRALFDSSKGHSKKRDVRKKF